MAMHGNGYAVQVTDLVLPICFDATETMEADVSDLGTAMTKAPIPLG